MQYHRIVVSLFSYFFFYLSAHHPDLHPFPTRRSSDLTLGSAGMASSMKPPQPATPAHGSAVVTVRLNEVRSEEHTSELQSRGHLVCRPLLEKKKKIVFRVLLIKSN